MNLSVSESVCEHRERRGFASTQSRPPGSTHRIHRQSPTVAAAQAMHENSCLFVGTAFTSSASVPTNGIRKHTIARHDLVRRGTRPVHMLASAIGHTPFGTAGISIGASGRPTARKQAGSRRPVSLPMDGAEVEGSSAAPRAAAETITGPVRACGPDDSVSDALAMMREFRSEAETECSGSRIGPGGNPRPPDG
jgi:hypothetical protein